jgi:putative component of membrane protein insertase Oxa1/YidC/SpoIIIJ protein YidD
MIEISKIHDRKIEATQQYYILLVDWSSMILLDKNKSNKNCRWVLGCYKYLILAVTREEMMVGVLSTPANLGDW